MRCSSAASPAHCVMTAGLCDAALELTAEYARTRTQFDRAIASFQAVSQRAADAYIDNEAVELDRVAGGLASRSGGCRPPPSS